jgi:hypothetical protein
VGEGLAKWGVGNEGRGAVSHEGVMVLVSLFFDGVFFFPVWGVAVD